MQAIKINQLQWVIHSATCTASSAPGPREQSYCYFVFPDFPLTWTWKDWYLYASLHDNSMYQELERSVLENIFKGIHLISISSVGWTVTRCIVQKKIYIRLDILNANTLKTHFGIRKDTIIKIVKTKIVDISLKQFVSVTWAEKQKLSFPDAELAQNELKFYSETQTIFHNCSWNSIIYNLVLFCNLITLRSMKL